MINELIKREEKFGSEDQAILYTQALSGSMPMWAWGGNCLFQVRTLGR